MIKVNKLFSFISSRCFLNEIENMFSVYLSSYRNIRESLGNWKKLWKHSPAARVPKAFLVLPNFQSNFYIVDRNTVHVFYFLNADCYASCRLYMEIVTLRYVVRRLSCNCNCSRQLKIQ